MTESELFKALGVLTRDRTRWETAIPDVASLLTGDSAKITAKALWLLGEMGLKHPARIGEHVPRIASFLDSPEPLPRERAVVALGRIGRGDYRLVEPYWSGLFRFARDEAAGVRLGFIWGSSGRRKTLRPARPTRTARTCRSSRSCWAIATTGSGWRRRRYSASSGNAGPSS